MEYIKYTREEFLSSIQEYIENDLVNVIYSNDNITIMNFANDVYALSEHGKNADNEFFSFLISKRSIIDFIEDNQLFFDSIKKMGHQKANKYYYPFNESLYNSLLKIKEITDINGPSKLIDLELEEEIKAKYMGKSK